MLNFSAGSRILGVIGALFATLLTAACDSNAVGGQSHNADARAAMTTRAASAPGPIKLGDAPITIALSATGTGLAASLAAGRELELVASGLRAAQQPGITYRLYLGVPAGAAPDDAHYVGTINFFNVVPLAGARPKPDQPLHFDVTARVRSLLADQAHNGDLAVTVVPEGKTENGAQPEIQSIQIVEK